MDNKAIETLSVNAVKNSIVTSDFLDQFINDNDNDNDKEPFWDGAIYIYDNKSKKKVILLEECQCKLQRIKKRKNLKNM